MTGTELKTALAGVAEEVNTVQAFLLGKLADLAADAGDGVLEAGYRYMAQRGMWPTRMRMDDDSPNDRLKATIDREPWGWMFPEHHTSVRYGHEMTVDEWLPKDSYATCQEALEAAARLIGEWLAGQPTPAGTEDMMALAGQLKPAGVIRHPTRQGVVHHIDGDPGNDDPAYLTTVSSPRRSAGRKRRKKS